MKRFIIIPVMLSALIVVACTSNEQLPEPTTTLSEQEIQDLLFLYEEEKMARDLYLGALERYDLMQFNNISASEQRHMDAVFGLIEQYGIENPASEEKGVFHNAELQDLYDQLEAQINVSETEALKAAALVEETDIMDIRALRLNTDLQDILRVYASLECGSGNHIRAFTSKLQSYGVTYAPGVMSESEYAEVLAQPHGGCGG